VFINTTVTERITQKDAAKHGTGGKMRAFKKPNLGSGWKCPICDTSEEKEVVLVGIIGTEDGNNIQAEQIHLDCIDLVLDKDHGLLYQKI
jgi:hypothetical protein